MTDADKIAGLRCSLKDALESLDEALKERDEALARCARLEEALRWLRDGVDTAEVHCLPVPITSSWRYVVDRGLDTTPSSLPWVNEKIVEELERLDAKLMEACEDSQSKDYQHGMRVAAATCRSRAAELRRKEGE